MPYGSGRTGVAGNLVGERGNLGRTGTPGNVAGRSPKTNYSVPTSGMVQTNSAVGRSARPGNDSSLNLPSRAAGTMQSKTGAPSSKGVPGKTTGKFTHKSQGLLKR